MLLPLPVSYHRDQIEFFGSKETNSIGPVPRIAGIGAHIGEIQMEESSEGKLPGQVSSFTYPLISFLTLY